MTCERCPHDERYHDVGRCWYGHRAEVDDEPCNCPLPNDRPITWAAYQP